LSNRERVPEQRTLYEDVEADVSVPVHSFRDAGFPEMRCDCGEPLRLSSVREIIAPNMNFKYVPYVIVIAVCQARTCCDWVFQRKGGLHDV
jgi:hypothetical protein